LGTFYETWLDCVFGQPVETEPRSWSPDVGDVSPAETVALLTRLFTGCGTDLARFDSSQVAQGLWYVVSPGNSDCMYHLYDRHVGWTARVACMRSIVTLYRDCFAIRCLDSATRNSNAGTAINAISYMWWDVFPSGGADDTTTDELAAVDEVLIGVMADALEVPHDACRESALHGLGHWHTADEARVRAIIDDWLARHHDLGPSLHSYARAAREGAVQ
jgi:hypothetical protein